MQRSRSKTLFDVLQAIEELGSFLDEVDKEHFFANRQLQLAVEREFEIMGEALNRLLRLDESAFFEIRDANKIVGLRNVIAHGYDIIDYEIIWDAASKAVGLLRTDVERLLEKE